MIDSFVGKKILVISGDDQQALPIIESFHKKGCFVSVCCNSRLDVGYTSKYTDKRILGIFSDKEQTESTVFNVLKDDKYDLVVPTNDFIATILSKGKMEFAKYAPIAVNDWNVFKLAIDKYNTMKVCMENHIPCPKTIVIDDVDDFDDKGWNYPLVVKPRIGFGARGFFIATNRKDLMDKFSLDVKEFGGVIIQEFIPAGGRQFQVEMMMDSNHECKSIVILDKIRWYPLEGGSSTINQVVQNDAIKQSCVKLLKLISWKGYAALDLIEDKRDGSFKILEINPRLNGTVKICGKAGIDIAQQIYEETNGLEVSEYKTINYGMYIRHFHKDLLWFLKSKERFCTSPSWFSWNKTVDEILDIKNPAPIISYTIQSFIKLVKLH